MREQPNLTQALKESAGTTPPIDTDTPPPTQTHARKARQNTKMIGGHFSKPVHRQLKQMALDSECSIQDLLGEALNLLFDQAGKPPIAKLEES